jgi:hypothetical protein
MQFHRYLLPVSILVASAIVSQAVGGTQAGADAPDVVQAKRFEVVNDHGKTRGVLEVTPDSMARLELFGANGATRAIVAAPPQGAVVALFDENRATRASVGVMPDGSTSLALSDKDQKPSVSVSLLPTGKSGLVISDNSAMPRVKFGVEPDETPDVSVARPGPDRSPD